jgi:hypothetical protein
MEPRAPIRQPSFILIDAHVHIYPCFDEAELLDGAAVNFQQGAEQVGVSGLYAGCLLLTEVAGSRRFRRWRVSGPAMSGPWSFAPTEEDDSLVARRESGERLFLIAGRQIVTAERIEVLALGRDADIPDGLELAATLDRVRTLGALPVLPWGFGKWWLRRGSQVEEAFRRRGHKELFLGDNAGRLDGAGTPPLFRQARAQGVPVLPGSDPLPFAEHGSRAGSYGFVLSGPLDEAHPAACVLRGIRRLKGQPRVFGRRTGWSSFLRDQAAIHWRRRAPAAPAEFGAVP